MIAPNTAYPDILYLGLAAPEKTLRPVPAAIGVIFRKGKVLLVRRKNPPDAGKWAFPGGKIEWGESIERSAEREILEETGVRAVAERIITAIDCYEWRDDELIRHYILIAVLCGWISGEPEASDDALEARWFKPAELENANLATSLDVPEIIRMARLLS